jgi:hypothetical protein
VTIRACVHVCIVIVAQVVAWSHVIRCNNVLYVRGLPEEDAPGKASEDK